MVLTDVLRKTVCTCIAKKSFSKINDKNQMIKSMGRKPDKDLKENKLQVETYEIAHDLRFAGPERL